MRNIDVSTDVKIAEVFRTYDYERFEILGGNRQIKDGHVKKIEESMLSGYIVNPIIVNENYQIIDGQHRFTALSNIEFPVDFIVVKGLGLDDCQRLNINSKNWSTKDFVESYANQGNEYYKKFLKFTEEFNFITSIQTCAFIVQNSKNNHFDGFMLGHLKSGDFKFTDEQYNNAVKVATMISDFKSSTDIYKDDKFQKAFMEIVKVEGYNHDRMLSKFETLEHKIEKKVKISLYYDMFTEIYNYRGRKEDKIYFNIILK